MPPNFDAVTTSALTTFSHTCSGDNRYLIVSVSSNASRPTAVSYAGVSMSLLYNNIAGDGALSVWGLVNPATGANNVVLTGGTSNSSIAASYKDVDQTSPISGGVGVTGTGTSTSRALVNPANSLGVSTTARPGAYSTFNKTFRAQSSGTWRGQLGDTTDVDPTFTWTYDISDWFIHYVVSLLGAAAAGLKAQVVPTI